MSNVLLNQIGWENESDWNGVGESTPFLLNPYEHVNAHWKEDPVYAYRMYCDIGVNKAIELMKMAIPSEFKRLYQKNVKYTVKLRKELSGLVSNH